MKLEPSWVRCFAGARADALLAGVDLAVVVPRVVQLDGWRGPAPFPFRSVDVHFVVFILQVFIPKPVVNVTNIVLRLQENVIYVLF